MNATSQYIGFTLRSIQCLALQAHESFVMALAFDNCRANPYTGTGPHCKAKDH